MMTLHRGQTVCPPLKRLGRLTSSSSAESLPQNVVVDLCRPLSFFEMFYLSLIYICVSRAMDCRPLCGPNNRNDICDEWNWCLLFSLFLSSLSMQHIEAHAEIDGGPEKYVKSGSTLKLTCHLRQSSVTPDFVFWYQDERMINYEGAAGVKVISDAASSTLIIERAQSVHSGNYSCVPYNVNPSSVIVHILNGMNPVRNARNSSACCLSTSLSLSLSLYIPSYFSTSVTTHSTSLTTPISDSFGLSSDSPLRLPYSISLLHSACPWYISFLFFFLPVFFSSSFLSTYLFLMDCLEKPPSSTFANDIQRYWSPLSSLQYLVLNQGLMTMSLDVEAKKKNLFGSVILTYTAQHSAEKRKTKKKSLLNKSTLKYIARRDVCMYSYS